MANSVFHGGKDRQIANSMLRTLGGDEGYRQRITVAPDGTVTTLRTKDGMPNVEVKRPQPQVSAVRGFVFNRAGAAWATVASMFSVSTRSLALMGGVSYTVAPWGATTAPHKWNDVWRTDTSVSTRLYVNGRRTPIAYPGFSPNGCELYYTQGLLGIARTAVDFVTLCSSSATLQNLPVPYGLDSVTSRMFTSDRSGFAFYAICAIPIPATPGTDSVGWGAYDTTTSKGGVIVDATNRTLVPSTLETENATWLLNTTNVEVSVESTGTTQYAEASARLGEYEAKRTDTSVLATSETPLDMYGLGEYSAESSLTRRCALTAQRDGYDPHYNTAFESTAVVRVDIVMTNASVNPDYVYPVKTYDIQTEEKSGRYVLAAQLPLFADDVERVRLYAELTYTVTTADTYWRDGLNTVTAFKTATLSVNLKVEWVLDYRGLLYKFDALDFDFTVSSDSRNVGVLYKGAALDVTTAFNTYMPPLPLPAPYTAQGECPFIAYTTKAEEAAGAIPEIYVDAAITLGTSGAITYAGGSCYFGGVPPLKLYSTTGLSDTDDIYTAIDGSVTTIQFANGVIGPWAQRLGGDFTENDHLEISRI